MPKFVIPRAEAETPVRESSDLFPKGVWQGQLEVVRIQPATTEPKSGAAFALSAGAEYGEIASIQLGEISAVVEGQPDVGRRKFFDELFLLSEVFSGGTTVQWDEPTGDENENWRFEQTRRRLTNLALATDAVEDDGNGGIGPVEHFDELLRSTSEDGGGLHGERVTFEIVHTKGKKKNADGVFPTYHQLKMYMPV